MEKQKRILELLKQAEETIYGVFSNDNAFYFDLYEEEKTEFSAKYSKYYSFANEYYEAFFEKYKIVFEELKTMVPSNLEKKFDKLIEDFYSNAESEYYRYGLSESFYEENVKILDALLELPEFLEKIEDKEKIDPRVDVFYKLTRSSLGGSLGIDRLLDYIKKEELFELGEKLKNNEKIKNQISEVYEIYNDYNEEKESLSQVHQDFYQIFKCEKLLAPIFSEMKELGFEGYDKISDSLISLYSYRRDWNDQKLYERALRNVILDVDYCDKSVKVETLIKAADIAVKSGDEQKIGQVQKFLSEIGRVNVLEYDEVAIDYLIENFSKENLKAVNNLRGFYGLKLEIEKYSIEGLNTRIARRIIFEGAFSASSVEGAELYDPYSKEFKFYLSKKDLNYNFNNIELGEKYKNYRPDYSKEYKASDYTEALKRSRAIRAMENEGVNYPSQKLKEALAKMKIPVEIVSSLNLKDISHIMVETYSEIDYDKGGKVFFDALNNNSSEGIREETWKNIAKDADLVKAISEDLSEMGTEQECIDEMWKCAREMGNPNLAHKKFEGLPVFLQIHHQKALKDGGTNDKSNFVVVVNQIRGINSHNPLHQKDSPIYRFYLSRNGDDFSLGETKDSENSMRVKFSTVFTANESVRDGYNRVKYYGGSNKHIYLEELPKNMIMKPHEYNKNSFIEKLEEQLNKIEEDKNLKYNDTYDNYTDKILEKELYEKRNVVR